MSISLTSQAFANNEAIPRRHTGDGEDVSPPLSWSDLPAGAKELALIMDDPDAPRAEPWVHWVIYKIPAESTGLEEGIAARPTLSEPAGAVQGENSWPSTGYRGPAPPRGHGMHQYHFKLYALDASLELPAGLEKDELLERMQGHVLAQGELVGTYQR